MESIRANFELSRSIGSRATAPETDASDNLISPIGWAKKNIEVNFSNKIKNVFVLCPFSPVHLKICRVVSKETQPNTLLDGRKIENYS
jgi:hypothetical protein